MNKLIITGNLGKTATTNTIGSGWTAINFTLACTEKMADGQENTTWIDCVRWVKPGGSTKLAEFLTKGQRVLVEGKAGVRAYNQSDGSARGVLECIVSQLEFIGAKPADQQAPPVQNNAEVNNQETKQDFNQTVSDDLPF